MTMPAEPCRAHAAFENVEITVTWMPQKRKKWQLLYQKPVLLQRNELALILYLTHFDAYLPSLCSGL